MTHEEAKEKLEDAKKEVLGQFSNDELEEMIQGNNLDIMSVLLGLKPRKSWIQRFGVWLMEGPWKHAATYWLVVLVTLVLSKIMEKFGIISEVDENLVLFIVMYAGILELFSMLCALVPDRQTRIASAVMLKLVNEKILEAKHAQQHEPFMMAILSKILTPRQVQEELKEELLRSGIPFGEVIVVPVNDYEGAMDQIGVPFRVVVK